MNKVAIDLGLVQIYWYSICIMLGMFVGMLMAYKEAEKHNIGENTMTSLIFNTVIVSLIGARIYYVIFEWGYYSKNLIEIFEIWNGGLAIHGGIIFGAMYLTLFTHQRKMSTAKMMDVVAPALLIGQIIGRWGNFFNGEAYGPLVERVFLERLHLPNFIIEGMYINGNYYQPTFLYESLWCLIGFTILLLFRRRKYIKIGQISGLYLMWYSFGRFFIESLRQDSLMLGSFKQAQIISVVLFMVGLFLFVRRIRSSRFEYLYNENKENIEIKSV